jgi:hypothetical protein
MPAAAAVNTSERAHNPLTWFDQIPPGSIRAGNWSDTIPTGSVTNSTGSPRENWTKRACDRVL